jgi:hypothetical protein
MTPGQLVRAVSIALDVPEETVVQHDRNLLVAGLRTKGGRGRSAPDVTPKDAARLIIAILGAVRVKDSVSVVQFFESEKVFPARADYPPLPFPKYAALPRNHSFVDGLAAIIEEANTLQMIENFQEFANRFAGFWIGVWGNTATIMYMPHGGGVGNKTEILYRSRPTKTQTNDARSFQEQWAQDFRGVEQERKIRGNCIMLLARAFREGSLPSASAAFRWLRRVG